MTNKNGPDDKDTGASGKGQRPYATLDLTANEISSGNDKERVQAAKQGSEGGKEQPKLDKPDSPSPKPSQTGDSLTGIVTHMTAGAFGAILALLAGIWAFGGPDGQTPPGLTKKDAEILRTAVTDAEARISALESELKQAAAQTGEADGLKSDLASLSERIAAVESRPAATSITEQSVQQSLDPIAAQLADMDRRLAALTDAQKERHVDGKAMAVSLAFYNLQRAAREGKPYGLELKAVAETSPVPLDLALLEPWRDEGVPSIDQLRESFDAAAKAAIDAENQPVDDSFMSKVWSQAKSFVHIRRKGNVEGEDTGAILARIEHHMDNSKLRLALIEVEKIDGVAAEAVAPWLRTLRKKLAAEDALEQIEAKLLNTIGGKDTATRDG